MQNFNHYCINNVSINDRFILQNTFYIPVVNLSESLSKGAKTHDDIG
jgi:hypothetical protein